MFVRKSYAKYVLLFGIIFLIISSLWIIYGGLPDKSYLQNKSCAPPCWHGIVPDVTSEEAVLNVLSRPELVRQASIRMDNSNDGLFRTYGYYLRDGGTGTLRLQNGIVYRIEISPGYKLTLVEIINTFGSPDFVLVKDNSSEIYCYDVEILYLRGIWARTGTCKNQSDLYEVIETSAKISPEMVIGRLVFFPAQTDLNNVFDNNLLSSLFTASDSKAINSSTWIGFGFYLIADSFENDDN